MPHPSMQFGENGGGDIVQGWQYHQPGIRLKLLAGDPGLFDERYHLGRKRLFGVELQRCGDDIAERSLPLAAVSSSCWRAVSGCAKFRMFIEFSLNSYEIVDIM